MTFAPRFFSLPSPILIGFEIVILGDAEDHEELGAVPVGLAEFPEGAAHRVDAGGGHVDRTEPAMRGVIRGAIGLRPPACEALALVAAGEEGEPFRGGVADRLQPFGGEGQRLFPADFREFSGAAGAGAFERRAQPRRRVVLHDARRALGAEHALVDGMVPVALDIADLAAFDVHVDAAATGAHVAGGLADLVGNGGREVDLGLIHRGLSSSFLAKAGHGRAVFP